MGNRLRALLLMIVAALAVGLAGPAFARIDHIRDLLIPGTPRVFPTNIAIDATVITQTVTVSTVDKQQLEDIIGELEKIAEDDPQLWNKLQGLYLVFSGEVTITRLKVIVDIPAACQFEQCLGVDDHHIVMLAYLVRADRNESDKDLVSRDGRTKARVADVSGSTADAGLQQIDYRTEVPSSADKSSAVAQAPTQEPPVQPNEPPAEPDEPVAEEQPVVAVEGEDPWWQEWFTPTAVVGLLTTIIAGSTGWYAIQHQRHQMRRDQEAETVALATIPGVGSLMEAAIAMPEGTPRSRAKFARSAAATTTKNRQPSPPPQRPTGSSSGAPRRSRSRSET